MSTQLLIITEMQNTTEPNIRFPPFSYLNPSPSPFSSMASSSSSSSVFTVRRRTPELVKPAKPTPHEFKYLSDIDDQKGLRFQLPVIQFYRQEPRMRGKDPVKVIRKAIAEALVFYYPFAGRLRERNGGKLVVDCTGEGVLFIEADADVGLEYFSNTLQPPFPCLELEELLYDVPGSGHVLGCPTLLVQVTRLMCGGFIFAVRFNHTMCGITGLKQFMSAVNDMARGLKEPSVLPVWKREILNARDPPRVTFLHREYDEVPNSDTRGKIVTLDDMAHRSFFFAHSELATLRKHLPPQLRRCSTFEVLTASLWRCHTIAIQPDPDEYVRLICVVSVRDKFQPPLPVGYYGNMCVYPVAVSTAAKLCQNPLGYALELVKKAKSCVTEEYMRSVADLMVMKGRPHFTVLNTLLVADQRLVGFRDVDFGLGIPVCGGIAKAELGAIPGMSGSLYLPFRNHKGEDGILVLICLPGLAMERFATEIESIIKAPPLDPNYNNKLANFIRASM